MLNILNIGSNIVQKEVGHSKIDAKGIKIDAGDQKMGMKTGPGAR